MNKEEIFQKCLDNRCQEHDKEMSYDMYLAVMDAMDIYFEQKSKEKKIE